MQGLRQHQQRSGTRRYLHVEDKADSEFAFVILATIYHDLNKMVRCASETRKEGPRILIERLEDAELTF